jgi:3-hydroxyacyl-CoA dehydrogenase
MDIKKVLIVGSGTLGGQIGWQCATNPAYQKPEFVK